MSHYVKTNEGYDVKVPSQGQVNLNTVLGSLGTASFLGMGGVITAEVVCLATSSEATATMDATLW